MNEYQIAIAIAAAFSAAVSWKIPNALKYIAFGALVAVACDVAYETQTVVYAAGFTFACDLAFCILIDWMRREKWEYAIRLVFLTSSLVSLIRLFSLRWPPGIIADDGDYRLYLELLNYAALLVISGIGIARLADGYFIRYRWFSGIHSFINYVCSARATPHFTRVKS